MEIRKILFIIIINSNIYRRPPEFLEPPELLELPPTEPELREGVEILLPLDGDADRFIEGDEGCAGGAL